MKAIVNSNDYQNDEDNKLRFMALSSFRHPQLFDSLNASWHEKTLNVRDFMELRVINGLGWDILSNFSGKVSAVADLVHNEPKVCIPFFVHKTLVNLLFWISGFHYTSRKCKKIMEAIVDIERKADFNTDLILLQSNRSRLATILEGNKTAVALHLKCCLKKELSYEPFRVFVGHLESKSRWQR